MTTRTDTESELVRRWIETSPRRSQLASGRSSAAAETGSFDWEELLETAERRRSALVAELGANAPDPAPSAGTGGTSVSPSVVRTLPPGASNPGASNVGAARGRTRRNP